MVGLVVFCSQLHHILPMTLLYFREGGVEYATKGRFCY